MRASMVTLAVVALSGCGAGAAATRDFPVGAFERVSNATPFDVRVRTGGAPAVRAEAPQRLLDRLDVSVRDGTLLVTTRRAAGLGGWSFGGQRAVVEVSVPALSGAELTGPGDLSVDRVRADRFTARVDGPGDLTVDRVEAHVVDATLNGPGDLRLAGRADAATLTLHGPGDIKAAGLTLRDAQLDLHGPGDLAVAVTGTARGMLNGPGDITVTGGGRCEIVKHGPGDVNCR